MEITNILFFTSCSTEKEIEIKENFPVRVERNPEQKIP
jgi:hypothetical protein